MSKFNVLLKSYMLPLEEKMSDEEATAKFKQMYEIFDDFKITLEDKGFKNIKLKKYASDTNATVKGLTLLFTYENGIFKVPMKIDGYIADFGAFDKDSEDAGDKTASLAYSVEDGSYEGKKTRHAAAKYVPGHVAKVITNKANDAMFTAKVQEPFINVLKQKSSAGVGPTSINSVEDNLSSIISYIEDNLSTAAEGANEMGKGINPPKVDAPKGLKKDIADMSDEEMDAYASKNAEKY